LVIYFLKKYPFVFDNDKKTISFINVYTEKNNEYNNSERINNYTNLLSKIKNLSIIIGIIIDHLIGKKVWAKHRKKRANELIDSFIYASN
jgi:hypothetical protein